MRRLPLLVVMGVLLGVVWPEGVAADWRASQMVENNLQQAASVLGESSTDPCPNKRDSTDPVPPTVFLVIFMGRSGSSAFMSEIAMHDQVLVPGYEPWNSVLPAFNRPPTSEECVEYMDDVLAMAEHYQCSAVGFKFRWSSDMDSVIRSHATRWNVHFVLQDRLNPLGLAISDYAHELQQATQFAVLRESLGKSTPAGSNGTAAAGEGSGAGSARPTSPPFRVEDWDRFDLALIAALRRSDLLRARAGSVRATSVYYYEEYISNREATMARFFDEIGVQVQMNAPRFQPVASTTVLCQRVLNYQAICERYWCLSVMDHRYLIDVTHGCTCSPIPECEALENPKPKMQLARQRQQLGYGTPAEQRQRMDHQPASRTTVPVPQPDATDVARQPQMAEQQEWEPPQPDPQPQDDGGAFDEEEVRQRRDPHRLRGSQVPPSTKLSERRPHVEAHEGRLAMMAEMRRAREERAAIRRARRERLTNMQQPEERAGVTASIGRYRQGHMERAGEEEEDTNDNRNARTPQVSTSGRSPRVWRAKFPADASPVGGVSQHLSMPSRTRGMFAGLARQRQKMRTNLGLGGLRSDSTDPITDDFHVLMSDAEE